MTSEKSVALLLGVVVGDGFTNAYHVVAPDTDEGHKVLKRKIATVWCAEYWKELRCDQSFEEFVEEEDLETAFEEYFANHGKESCEISAVDVGEITVEEIGALVAAKQAKDQGVVAAYATTDFMPEARLVGRDPLIAPWLEVMHESALSLSKRLQERANEDLKMYMAEKDKECAATVQQVEKREAQLKSTVGALMELTLTLVRGFYHAAPVDWIGRDLQQNMLRLTALWNMVKTFQPAETSPDMAQSIGVTLAQQMLLVREERTGLARIVQQALDGGMHQARPQLEQWLRTFQANSAATPWS